LPRQRIDGGLNEANQLAAGEAFGLASRLASCVAGMLATWRDIRAQESGLHEGKHLTKHFAQFRRSTETLIC
jgi:hypothetical protein